MEGDQRPGGTSGFDRSGVVEHSVFGMRETAEIDALVDAFCRRELGSAVSDVLFSATSVGVVRGVRLSDGRGVVVKSHQPRESRTRLEAVHELQAEFFRAGLPCPEPLVGPVSLGTGFTVAEALLDAGDVRDTHDPWCRRLIADALAWQLALAGPRECPQALSGGWDLYAPAGLWPRHAHAPIFDFAVTRIGAEWIDAIATRAKPLTARPGRPIAGHTDSSGKHFRFDAGKLTAIYDWDSLAVRTEPAIVGNAAITSTTNFEMPGIKRAPEPGEVRAFIDEYSAARPAPLTRAERTQVMACATFLAAYTARCEHCAIDRYRAAEDPCSFTAALREHGLAYLDA